MKKLLLAFLFLSPMILDAQWSVFGEYTLDPIKRSTNTDNVDLEERPSLVKEFNVGINYKLPSLVSLRTGIAYTEKRNAHNTTFFQDQFIQGFISQFNNQVLRHSSGIRSFSAFAGLQIDLNRFHIGSHIHYSRGVFKDEAIIAREYFSMTGIVRETVFDIDYNNISFFKSDFNISFDVLKAKKGSITIVLKYIKDYNENRTFTVNNYAPEVKEMVENFPGTSYYDIDAFLEGGDLYYERAFYGIGLRMTYNLGLDVE